MSGFTKKLEKMFSQFGDCLTVSNFFKNSKNLNLVIWMVPDIKNSIKQTRQKC